jgi:hypothetical protein
MTSRLSSMEVPNPRLWRSDRATGSNSTETLKYGQSRLTNANKCALQFVQSCRLVEPPSSQARLLAPSLAFYHFRYPHRHRVHLAIFPLRGSDTGLPCSAEMTRSIRSALYAGSGDTHGRVIGSLAMLIREIRCQLSVDP